MSTQSVGIYLHKPRLRFTLVLILVGHSLGLIGATAYIRNLHEQRTKALAAELKGESLVNLANALQPGSGAGWPQLRTVLQEAMARGNWIGLRLVDRVGQIVCSARPEEEGTLHIQADQLASLWPTQLTCTRKHLQSMIEQLTYRTPLPANGAPAWMLEGVIGSASLVPPLSLMTSQIWMVPLASTLALLILLAYLSRQIGPLGEIGLMLLRHRARLREELSSLRLASERSLIASAWNQLVTLAEEFRQTAGEPNTHRELHSALAYSSRFITAANTIPDGILHLRGSGEEIRLGFANTTACRFLGVEPSQADPPSDSTDRRFRDIGGHELGRGVVQAIRSSHTQRGWEAKTMTVSGGDDHTLRVRVLPVLGNRQRSEAVVFLTDISQQAKAEQAREKLLSQVAHELRTPLTNIQAYAETLGDFDDPQVRAECFNVINKETRRLARLVEEMLSRAQLDLGSLQIRYDDVDCLALLEEAVRDLRATAEAKGLELQTALPAKLPTLQADRDKLAVVVNNLIANAIKYTPSSGRVTVKAVATNDHVEIHVIDTGIGIRPQDHSRVFEHMFRGDHPQVQQQQGTGLGLTTAQEIVHAHGGQLTLQSELDKGSTFTVELPIVPAGPEKGH